MKLICDDGIMLCHYLMVWFCDFLKALYKKLQSLGLAARYATDVLFSEAVVTTFIINLGEISYNQGFGSGSGSGCFCQLLPNRTRCKIQRTIPDMQKNANFKNGIDFALKYNLPLM